MDSMYDRKSGQPSQINSRHTLARKTHRHSASDSLQKAYFNRPININLDILNGAFVVNSIMPGRSPAIIRGPPSLDDHKSVRPDTSSSDSPENELPPTENSPRNHHNQPVPKRRQPDSEPPVSRRPSPPVAPYLNDNVLKEPYRGGCLRASTCSEPQVQENISPPVLGTHPTYIPHTAGPDRSPPIATYTHNRSSILRNCVDPNLDKPQPAIPVDVAVPGPSSIPIGGVYAYPSSRPLRRRSQIQHEPGEISRPSQMFSPHASKNIQTPTEYTSPQSEASLVENINTCLGMIDTFYNSDTPKSPANVATLEQLNDCLRQHVVGLARDNPSDCFSLIQAANHYMSELLALDAISDSISAKQSWKDQQTILGHLEEINRSCQHLLRGNSSC